MPREAEMQAVADDDDDIHELIQISNRPAGGKTSGNGRASLNDPGLGVEVRSLPSTHFRTHRRPCTMTL